MDDLISAAQEYFDDYHAAEKALEPLRKEAAKTYIPKSAELTQQLYKARNEVIKLQNSLTTQQYSHDKPLEKIKGLSEKIGKLENQIEIEREKERELLAKNNRAWDEAIKLQNKAYASAQKLLETARNKRV